MTPTISSPISIGTKLVHAVQKEAAMQSPLPLSASAHEDLPKGGRVEASVKLVDNDRLSHLAEAIMIEVQNPKTKFQSPQVVAERFAERATYLTERLQFVEGNAQGAAILRSTPATMRGRRAEYFEARVTEAELSIQRFKPHDDKPGRESVPFCVTADVLARLADDAANILSTGSRTAK